MAFKIQHYHDYYYSFFLGIISAFFLFLAEKNFELAVTYPQIYIVTFSGVPLMAILGTLAAKILFYKIHPIWQFCKFFLIGVTNTIINFGTFDFLVHVSGINTGVIVSFFGAVSFTAAMINSYIWNSHWSFHNSSPRTLSEFIRFFLVTLTGLFLSIAVIFVIVNFIPYPKGINAEAWVNIANLIASFVVMFWSFFGYKYLVFERQMKVHTLPQNQAGLWQKVV